MIEMSTLGNEVVQPTAEEMMRTWQAYQMVIHGAYPLHALRKLSVSMEINQLRLSVVIFTIITSALAVAALFIARRCEPFDDCGEHINLPQSQLDWMVEAARQYHMKGDHYRSYVDYAKDHEDLFCEVSTTRKGLSRIQITLDRYKPILVPFYSNPRNILGGLSSALTPGGQRAPSPQTSEGYFDPYSLYRDSHSGATSTTSTVGHGKYQRL